MYRPYVKRPATMGSEHWRGMAQGSIKCWGIGRYVAFIPMWERTICGFRAGRRGYTQRACFV